MSRFSQVFMTVIPVVAFDLNSANSQESVPRVQQSQPPAAIVVNGQPACATCRITLTRIARIGDPSDPVLLGPISRIAMTSRGTIYASSFEGREVVIFDSTGKYTSTFSRAGSGPGEIGSGHPWLEAGHADTLYIVSGRRAMVFSPEGVWQRTYTIPTTNTFTALDAGRIVVSGKLFRDTSSTYYPLHLLSPPGNSVERSFGSVERIKSSCGWCGLFSVGRASGGRSAWVLPTYRYELTHWGIDGRLLDRISIVDSPWFKEFNPDPPRGQSPEFQTRFMGISQDAAGIIWIRGAAAGSASDFTTVIDAYDPETRRIVANLRMDEADVRLLGGNIAAIKGETPLGTIYFDLVRLSVTRQ